MKYWLLSVGLILPTLAWAQAPEVQATADTSASIASDDATRRIQRENLAQARQTLEAQYKQDMQQCYQNFDVTSCRLKARDRRIAANSVLRQEEIRFNAQERRLQAEQAQREVAERNSEAERKNAEAQRAANLANAKDRVDANAQKQIDHALQGTKRGEFEQKQRDAAQHREDVARKLRERNKAPAAPLPVPQ